jgi:hypothetical protein
MTAGTVCEVVMWHRWSLAAGEALADMRAFDESVVPDYESTNRLPVDLLQVPR